MNAKQTGFTDKDLKRLKDYYEDPKRGDTPLKWKALLARLDAAENRVNQGCQCGCARCLRADEIWRIAAGKGD